MTNDISIRDLIYFDFGKAASLFSQLEGGLPNNITESYESGGDQGVKRNYNLLNTFKAEFGEMSSEKHAILEGKILHHDLFNKVEFILSKAGMVCDLNELKERDTSDPRMIQKHINEKSYIKGEGWAVFEDYSRIEDLTIHHNELIAFIRRCESDKLSEKDNAETENESSKTRKEKRKLLNSYIKEGQLPDWLFEGIRLWMNVFMKDRLNLRIVPFEDCPSMELLCNLKRDCFIDDDISHILYGYGVKPNIKLSVFGLITSMPPEGELAFDLFDQLEEINESDEKALVEKAFRNLFPAFEGLESFTTFHKFPRVIIHPIAVFRDIKGVLPKE